MHTCSNLIHVYINIWHTFIIPVPDRLIHAYIHIKETSPPHTIAELKYNKLTAAAIHILLPLTEISDHTCHSEIPNTITIINARIYDTSFWAFGNARIQLHFKQNRKGKIFTADQSFA